VPKISIAPMLIVANAKLRESLKLRHASPFIAHHHLPNEISESLIEPVKEYVNGSTERLIRIIENFPALGCWKVAQAISEHYGDEGDNSVYRHIAREFGLGESIPNQSRAGINRAFRSACRALGLSLPSRLSVFFVDDYVVQAGVAKSQLAAMCEAFLRAESLLGDPPTDDTQSLNVWEDRAANFADVGLTRLRKILWHDESAYHALAYARVRTDQPAENEFEKGLKEILAEHLAKHPNRNRTVHAHLSLVLQEDTLAVATPQGGAPIDILLADRTHRISAGKELHLPLPWPDAITWRSADNDTSQSLAIFSGSRILLAFDADSNRHLRTLGLPDGDSKIILDAHEVVLVARQQFSVDGENAYQLGREAYILYVSLRKPAIAAFDDVELELLPTSRPRLGLTAARIGASPEGPLWGQPQSVSVLFNYELPEGGIDLRLSHPALSEDLVEHIANGNEFEIDLIEKFPTSGRVGPLSVSLVISGTERVLTRARYYVWPGLKSLQNGIIFDAEEIPENLDPRGCRFIEKTNTGKLCLDMSASYRKAQLSFALSDTRILYFEVPRAGVTVAISDRIGSEVFVPAGSEINVSQSSDEYLIIRTDNSNDQLVVLGRIEERSFLKSGTRRIPFAALQGYQDSDTIELVKSDKSQFTLVKVRQSSAPISFDVIPIGERLYLDIRLPQEIDGVKLSMFDLFTNEEVTCGVALGPIPLDIGEREFLSAEYSDTSRNSVRACIQPHDLSAGLWVANLNVRTIENQEWEKILSPRGDHYLFTVASSIPDPATFVDLHELDTIFLRMTDALNNCIADNCWSYYGPPIENYWSDLGTQLTSRKNGRQIMLSAAFRPLPFDASPTWVPIAHPIEICADLFSATSIELNGASVGDIAGLDLFPVFADIASTERIRVAFQKYPINPDFIGAFANVAEAMMDDGTRLEDFSFKVFADDCTQKDEQGGAFWRPGREILTMAHHSWALDQFISRVEQVAPDGSNANRYRMPHAAQLIQSVRQVQNIDHLKPLEVHVERRAIAEYLPRFFSYLAQTSRRGQADALWNELGSKMGEDQLALARNVGFLIRLAPEILCFYLILWELVGKADR
jgi:hypothetical protein